MVVGWIGRGNMKLIGDTYNDYRNRVTAKTDGTNVHKVNGWLGIVVNGSLNIQWLETQPDKQDQLNIAKDAVADAIRNIAIATGVHP